MWKNIKNQKGTTLLLALLILAVIFAIALGVSQIILNQIKLTGRTGDSVLAFYAADSGVECGLYEILKNQSNICSSIQKPQTLPNGATIVGWVSTTSSVDVVGEFYFVRRGIKVEW